VGTRLETANGMQDGIKWFFAITLLVGGVGGFYYYADQSLLLRVIGLLLAAGVCAAILLQTDQGRNAWRMAQDARTEVRKVVWPTRKETVQTTGIVIAMVSVVAVILWLFDSLLGFILRQFLGHGG
jgi:preprotein translocase subunit SecE